VLTQQDGKAAFIDLDHNGAPSIISRLQAFGVPDDVLADQQRFRLTQDDGIELREVVQDLAVFAPDIAVLDSLGEALSLYNPSWLILVFKLSADFGDRFAQVVG
jgi:hypothetical protein